MSEAGTAILVLIVAVVLLIVLLGGGVYLVSRLGGPQPAAPGPKDPDEGGRRAG